MNIWSILVAVALIMIPLTVVSVIFIATSKATGQFSAAFIATTAVIPLLASIGIVIAYLILTSFKPGTWQEISDWAVISGSWAGFISWISLALIYTGVTSVRRANITSYNELTQSMETVRAQLDSSDFCGKDEYKETASCKEARGHYRLVAEKLGLDQDGTPKEDDNKGINKDLQWVLGSGYINLWNRVHRAKEALMEVGPTEAVIRKALRDEQRLTGSAIEAKDILLENLRLAISVLDENAVMYLSAPPKTNAAIYRAARTEQNQTEAGTTATSAEKKQARAVLRGVRQNINEFRDGRWDGLVRARNHLIETVTFTGLTMYVLVVIAVLTCVPRDAMLAAAVFFLVGAIIGLFKRLRDESAADVASENDYGLSRARLVHTPLFSGLAAIGGVIIIGMAPALLNTEVLAPKKAPTPTAMVTATISSGVSEETPTNTRGAQTALPATHIAPTSTIDLTATKATPTQTGLTSTESLAAAAATETALPNQAATTGISPPKELPSLEEIFNLRLNPFGLIVAATFGLAPALLIGALQKQIEDYKRDIRSTNSSDGPSGQST